jgi:hypothetical protein
MKTLAIAILFSVGAAHATTTTKTTTTNTTTTTAPTATEGTAAATTTAPTATEGTAAATTTGTATAPKATTDTATKTVEGAIAKVVARKKEIYVQGPDKKHEFYFKPTTELTQNGQTTAFETLKEGQKVRVTYVTVGKRTDPVKVEILQ